MRTEDFNLYQLTELLKKCDAFKSNKNLRDEIITAAGNLINRSILRIKNHNFNETNDRVIYHWNILLRLVNKIKEINKTSKSLESIYFKNWYLDLIVAQQQLSLQILQEAKQLENPIFEIEDLPNNYDAVYIEAYHEILDDLEDKEKKILLQNIEIILQECEKQKKPVFIRTCFAPSKMEWLKAVNQLLVETDKILGKNNIVSQKIDQQRKAGAENGEDGLDTFIQQCSANNAKTIYIGGCMGTACVWEMATIFGKNIYASNLPDTNIVNIRRVENFSDLKYQFENVVIYKEITQGFFDDGETVEKAAFFQALPKLANKDTPSNIPQGLGIQKPLDHYVKFPQKLLVAVEQNDMDNIAINYAVDLYAQIISAINEKMIISNSH